MNRPAAPGVIQAGRAGRAGLAGLAGAIGRFVLTPAEHARYDTDAASAARWLQLAEPEITALADAGLPHLTDSRHGPLFDYTDLVNTAMFCGSGQSVPELALRFLLRFAVSPAETWYEPRKWLVGMRLPEVPGPERDRPLIRVRVPDLSADGVAEVPEAEQDGFIPPAGTEPIARGYQLVVQLSGAPGTLADRRVRAVWNEVVGALASGEVIYQTVPESLRMAHQQAWQLGMADCIVVSRLLAERIRKLGLPARARRGYLLGLVGSDHAWCEVHEGGRWQPLDAVFAFAAAGGAPDRNLRVDAPAFAEACYGGRFNRLLPCTADDAAPLVYFGERPAPGWALAGISARPWQSA